MNKDIRVIKTGLERNAKYGEILSSVVGQMSDGMWENCNRLNGYWIFAECKQRETNIIVSNEYFDRYYDSVRNPYKKMTDQEIRNFFAKKIKQIVREDLKDNYEYEIAKDIFKKYDLEDYCRMCTYPTARADDYFKAEGETIKYLKENPFNFRGKFNAENAESIVYLSYHEDIQVKDAYYVYNKLIKYTN